MATPTISTRVVQEDIFDGKSLLDEENFYHQRHGTPDQLTDTITYLFGDYGKNYPISMMTMGEIAGKKAPVKELTDFQYDYPVMGRTDKASVIASTDYSAGDKPGIGHSEFTVRFTDDWIKRFYVIESANGVQCYVNETPKKDGDGYLYKLVLHAATSDQFCDLSELQAGTLWVDLNTQVAESESRGTESKMVAPGKMKNQMGNVRLSMSWAGNAAEKVMKINMKKGDGETTNLWMDYFMWQFEQRWLQELEHSYWYSRYNVLANNTVALKDPLTGKPIRTGSGLLEQIQNKSTHSTLTYSSIANKIGEALYGQSDTDDMVITLWTGKGGRRDVHRALMAEGATFLADFGMVADKFISGSGNSMHDLMLGGFFSGFYHIDGYKILIKYNPIFDMGRIALKSPIHPESGLPLESHRLVFIDQNDYDGVPNIQHVTEKGRTFIHGVVPGLTKAPKTLDIMSGSNGLRTLTSDQDKGSYHRMKPCGSQIMRASKCFDSQCVF